MFQVETETLWWLNAESVAVGKRLSVAKQRQSNRKLSPESRATLLVCWHFFWTTFDTINSSPAAFAKVGFRQSTIGYNGGDCVSHVKWNGTTMLEKCSSALARQQIAFFASAVEVLPSALKISTVYFRPLQFGTRQIALIVLLRQHVAARAENSVLRRQTRQRSDLPPTIPFS